MNMERTLHYALIITIETPGTFFASTGSVTVQWTFLQSWFNLLFSLFRSSQHGVFISWHQRFPLRYYLLFSPVNVTHKAFCQGADWNLFSVAVTTGGVHIQLLGDSSFEFSPWTPGTFTFNLELCMPFTPLLHQSDCLCSCVMKWLHHYGLRVMTKAIWDIYQNSHSDS